MKASRFGYFLTLLWIAGSISGISARESSFIIESDLLFNQRPQGAVLENPSDGPFSVMDERIYYRINWKGYQAHTEYSYEWVTPSGKVINRYANKRDTNSNGSSWGSISSQDLYDGGPGRWTARFYYDGELRAKKSFLFNDPGKFRYLMYAPDFPNLEAGIIVSVHSSSYNPIEYFHMLKPLARKKHMVLVAPYFRKSEFRYQRIYTGPNRADLYLKEILGEVKMKTGASTDRLIMYGKSAGGQFVHRYLLAYPETVSRMVVAAPGWYTFPDTSLEYPYGLKIPSSFPADVSFALKEALQIPVMVTVGDLDIERTSNLNQSNRADAQGRNRLQRAAYWMNRMGEAAIRLQVPFRFQHRVVTGADHGSLRNKAESLIDGFLESNDRNEEIAWSMEMVPAEVGPAAVGPSMQSRDLIQIQVRSEKKPRALYMGAEPSRLGRIPMDATSWSSRGGLHLAQVKPPFRERMVFAVLEMQDGSKTNLIGLVP